MKPSTVLICLILLMITFNVKRISDSQDKAKKDYDKHDEALNDLRQQFKDLDHAFKTHEHHANWQIPQMIIVTNYGSFPTGMVYNYTITPVTTYQK